MSITPSPQSPVPIIKKESMLSMIERGIREDGRKTTDYRPINIELGYAAKADGSALVKIGDTTVLAGVKVEDGLPMEDSPEQGNLFVNLELPPIASESFELGPPDENAIELARVVDRSLRDSKMIDLSKLSIIPGKKVWNIWVDIYVLDHGGNILDASTLAAVAALYTTKIPKYEINGEEIIIDKSQTLFAMPVNYPVVTVTVGKIGKYFIVDPNIEEEQILDAKVSFSYTPEQRIVGIQKTGSGSLSFEEITEAENIASSCSVQLLEELKKNVLNTVSTGVNNG
ncbi:exosome complex exonuclease [Sulfolobales archaeon HS-7]|nr:exosome complex exonuclease [Sulfolobales archaeon HS-7]